MQFVRNNRSRWPIGSTSRACEWLFRWLHYPLPPRLSPFPFEIEIQFVRISMPGARFHFSRLLALFPRKQPKSRRLSRRGLSFTIPFTFDETNDKRRKKKEKEKHKNSVLNKKKKKKKKNKLKGKWNFSKRMIYLRENVTRVGSNFFFFFFCKISRELLFSVKLFTTRNMEEREKNERNGEKFSKSFNADVN